METALNLVKIALKYTNYVKFRDIYSHQFRVFTIEGSLKLLLAN